ncbi:hypothetical protein CC2G_005052 [Coprinopsis cinerea AmutBmut pab1-1]|nr:hypothetical protein CC2G_005052 [Coprinopsis cinerea AmutBmut pab1-1]
MNSLPAGILLQAPTNTPVWPSAVLLQLPDIPVPPTTYLQIPPVAVELSDQNGNQQSHRIHPLLHLIPDVRSTPIDNLANEILLSVFEYCLTLRDREPKEKLNILLSLSRVCRRWRMLVTTTPTFWNAIYLRRFARYPGELYWHRDDRFDRWVHKSEQLFQRTGPGLPLSVTMDLKTGTSGTETIDPRIFSTAGQWEELDITLTISTLYLVDYLPAMSSETIGMNLKALKFTLKLPDYRGLWHPLDTQRMILEGMKAFLRSTPRLYLDLPALPSLPCPLYLRNVITWPDLTHLHLRTMNVSFLHIGDILTLSPNLVYLNIWVAPIAGTAPYIIARGTVKHPKLQTFHLLFGDLHPDALVFSANLELPALKSLGLFITQPPAGVYANCSVIARQTFLPTFISRFGQQLEILFLEEAAPYPDMLNPFLNSTLEDIACATPNLVQFQLKCATLSKPLELGLDLLATTLPSNDIGCAWAGIVMRTRNIFLGKLIIHSLWPKLRFFRWAGNKATDLSDTLLLAFMRSRSEKSVYRDVRVSPLEEVVVSLARRERTSLDLSGLSMWYEIEYLTSYYGSHSDSSISVKDVVERRDLEDRGFGWRG